jgi:hypothetical protein
MGREHSKLVDSLMDRHNPVILSFISELLEHFLALSKDPSAKKEPLKTAFAATVTFLQRSCQEKDFVSVVENLRKSEFMIMPL